MVNLTFGEQVKIILSRKGMTIKQLAEEVEKHTGKPMSRQNMTQRLGRDNFQEQDMRMIAEILGCQFTLSIMEQEETEKQPDIETVEEETVEEETVTKEVKPAEIEKEMLRKGVAGFFRKSVSAPEKVEVVETSEKQTLGEINPYTRKEYETNSVRMHPKCYSLN